mgnify:CR=1 FL=1
MDGSAQIASITISYLRERYSEEINADFHGKEQTMSKDTIYREDAIKALRLEYPMMPMFKNLREEWAIKTEGFRKAEEVIMSIPSADRPQGEWVKHDDERDYCSVCKHIFKTRTLTKQDKWTTYVDDLGYNYCPNCGARMKGADDETN